MTEVRHTKVKRIKPLQTGGAIEATSPLGGGGGGGGGGFFSAHTPPPPPPPPPPPHTAKKFNNVKNVQAMTTKRFLGTFLFLGTFQSRRDVYVNIDVKKAIEFWQPCFRHWYKNDLFLF